MTRIVDAYRFASGLPNSLERSTTSLSAFDVRHPHLMFEMLDECDLVRVWSPTWIATVQNCGRVIEQQLLAEVAPVADSYPLDFRCV